MSDEKSLADGPTDPMPQPVPLGPGFAKQVEDAKANGEKKPRSAKASGAAKKAEEVPEGSSSTAPHGDEQAETQKPGKSALKIAEELLAENAPTPDILNRAPKPISRFSNLEEIRADTSHEDAGTTEKPLLVPVKRPSDEKCIRVHPGPDFQFQNAVICIRSADRKPYLFSGKMANKLQGRQALVTLFLCIDRQDNPDLWPVKQNRPGKTNDFNTTALDAAGTAMKSWVYIVVGDNCYAAKSPIGKEIIPEPD